ncbi:hypothetical protein ACHAXS_014395, partial [Conticribra weissflogii]
ALLLTVEAPVSVSSISSIGPGFSVYYFSSRLMNNNVHRFIML